MLIVPCEGFPSHILPTHRRFHQNGGGGGYDGIDNLVEEGRMSYGQREATRGSSEEHQKSREGGKTKADLKTFAEENATSARATGRESQTITTLSVKARFN